MQASAHMNFMRKQTACDRLQKSSPAINSNSKNAYLRQKIYAGRRKTSGRENNLAI
jgi:hypothetical protein